MKKQNYQKYIYQPEMQAHANINDTEKERRNIKLIITRCK